MLASPALAQKGLPTPTNFRVTAKTAYSVTLAWDSVKTSKDFKWRVWSTARDNGPFTLPRTQTSFTFTNELYPGNEYWFGIYAVDASGKAGKQVTTSTRTLLDTMPPWTAPVVSLGSVGSNYAELSWTPPQDDGTHFFYQIWVDGSLAVNIDFPKDVTAWTLRYLKPSTTYSITVRGRDYGNLWSPFSQPVVITTPPPNPDDVTAPTTPGWVVAYNFGDGSTETQIQWAQSTDDFDAAANIGYEVYINGRLMFVVFGTGGPFTEYADFGWNTIEVVAFDTAGNCSAPAVTTVFF
jgi:hypothetical protein